MEPFVVLLVLVLMATPILAIAAYVRVRKLAGQMPVSAGQPELTARIYALEQRLAHMDKALARLSAVPPQPEGPAAAQAPTPAPRPMDPAAIEPHPPATTMFLKVPAPPPSAATPHPQPPSSPIAHTGSAAPPPSLRLPASASSKSSSPLDMENLIAGRWLNRIGITAVLVSVSYFLKYAFDNNWIGPGGGASPSAFCWAPPCCPGATGC